MNGFGWLRAACTLALALVLHTGLYAQCWGDQGNGSYCNPVLNADLSDPDVVRVGDRYYMTASDFHFMGMQLMESDDLLNWRYVSRIYDRLEFPEYDSMQRYGGGSWAPALRYHDGSFFVFFCTPHEGLFMCRADKPEGPWSKPLLVHAVEKWEDPCPFWDDDGHAYLGHSLYGAGPIIIHRMSADGTRLLDDGVTVYRGPVAEGTKIHKRNGRYYLSIPEGGVRGGWQTVLRADSIYGPYERRVVLEQGSTDVNGPHQGAMVDTPSGEWWFLHFQETDALGRVLHLQPMHWSADGWPVIGVDFDGNGVGEPVQVWTSPQVGTDPLRAAAQAGADQLSAAAQTLTMSDDFSLQELGLQWQWNHNPVDSAWSLTEHYGELSLHALPALSLREARNTITQKAVGFRGSATTVLCTEDLADGQRAGMACLGKHNSMAGVLMRDGRKYVYFGNDSTETDVCQLPEGTARVYLRLNLDFPDKVFCFEYSFNGKDYLPAGAPFYTRWGNWKGVRPALFSYNLCGTGGVARFTRFDYINDVPFSPTAAPSASLPMCAIDNAMPHFEIAQTHFPSRTFTVNTKLPPRMAIQAAIDSCCEAGGGRVVVPPGDYLLNGSIVLKSNVDLHIEEGASLIFSGDPDDFLPPVFTRWEGTELFGHSPMLYALHACNIAITGGGTIDGAAGKEMAAWAGMEVPDRDRLRAQGEDQEPLCNRVYGEGTVLRPTCIEFVGCSRILVEDITVKDSPFWTIHPLYCDNVVVRGVTIDSHNANNDGCDPESTSNVLIEYCNFNVGDDAIAIKAGRDADGRRVARPAENILIRHCIFNSECNGLCIGSEMSGGVQNVCMHDIRIGTVKNAIYFKSNRDRGGYIRNVFVSDIDVDHTLGAVLRFETNYFGFRGGKHASQYENFHIRNVNAGRSDHCGLFISGYPEKPVRNVCVQNMTVGFAPEPYYLHCTEDVVLENVRVNGVLLPEHPQNTPQEKVIDVY